MKRLTNGTNAVRTAWRTMSLVPGGRRAFSRLLGRFAPYTGAMGAEVLELGAGHARTELRDRRAVRNHLDSIHAIALANVGEFTTGVALTYSLPPGGRIILKRLEIDYLKKARGTVVASCAFDPPTSVDRRDFPIDAEIVDAAGDPVARLRVHWLVGPRQPS